MFDGLRLHVIKSTLPGALDSRERRMFREQFTPRRLAEQAALGIGCMAGWL